VNGSSYVRSCCSCAIIEIYVCICRLHTCEICKHLNDWILILEAVCSNSCQHGGVCGVGNLVLKICPAKHLKRDPTDAYIMELIRQRQFVKSVSNSCIDQSLMLISHL
jgi:hypothetical protein